MTCKCWYTISWCPLCPPPPPPPVQETGGPVPPLPPRFLHPCPAEACLEYDRRFQQLAAKNNKKKMKWDCDIVICIVLLTKACQYRAWDTRHSFLPSRANITSRLSPASRTQQLEKKSASALAHVHLMVVQVQACKFKHAYRGMKGTTLSHQTQVFSVVFSHHYDFREAICGLQTSNRNRQRCPTWIPWTEMPASASQEILCPPFTTQKSLTMSSIRKTLCSRVGVVPGGWNTYQLRQ